MQPIVSEKSTWSSVWGGILAFLILVLPALVGYNTYLQWNSPTMDFYLDRPGSSTVHSVSAGGHAEAAGLQAGDVILTADDIPFELWHTPQIGQAHILKIERQGEQFSLAVPAARVLELNYLVLISASVVVLAFWAMGTLLFLRRFWHPEIRLIFCWLKRPRSQSCFPCLIRPRGAHHTACLLLVLPGLILRLLYFYITRSPPR